ncbi:MAG TPA: lasso peptide biosynthesis B2 protein [Micromonosporaceae bacterium]|nr:lasso peptide biosynthesis B2 protein [Micromonosporaceae bacterium]
MTVPGALSRPAVTLPLRRRVITRFAVSLARLLALLPPRRIRSVLSLLRLGATPARYEEAKAARDAVLAISLACLGPKGCLPRSLATTLLCRMSGRWPSWCVGIRNLPPFGAHAWVEADGRLVDENMPDRYLSRLIVVPPKGLK